MDIHIRTSIRTWWSYVEAAAIRLGDTVVELTGSTDNDMNEWLWINGAPYISLKKEHWYRDEVNGLSIRYIHMNHGHRRVKIFLGDSKKEYVILESFKEMVKVALKGMHPETFTGSLGLLGHYPDGKRVGRDGVSLIQDVQAFGQEWQVLEEEPKLFQSYEGVVQAPTKCTMPTELEGESSNLRKRRLGEAFLSTDDIDNACAHVKDPVERQACRFDVMVTNDVGMAGAF